MRLLPTEGAHFEGYHMAKPQTVGLSYEALRKECTEAIRRWPRARDCWAIRIIHEKTPGGSSVRVTLYGKANKKLADRAINFVQREKRRHFHLKD